MIKILFAFIFLNFCSSSFAESLKEILETRTFERDVTGNKTVVPVGFSESLEEFVFIRKIKDCKCKQKDKKTVCEIYSYADVSPSCVPGIDEILIQNLLTDKIKSVKKAKGPANPISYESAVQVLKDQKVSIRSLELKKFPMTVKNVTYTASVSILKDNETHEVILSSSKGDKPLGHFENFGGPDAAIKSEVIGFLETPDPERIIVVTSLLSRYFEDETSERVQFWGASLVSGFVKKPEPKK